jgi:hypothetical protein
VNIYRLAISAVLFAAAFAQATPAHAQGGLFGSTRSDTGRGDRLNVTFAVSEAYDTDLPAELRARLPQSDPYSGGFSTMLMTSAQYTNAGRRGQITGSGETSFRYSRKLAGVAAVGHSGALGARANLSRLATAEVNQTLAYSPSYLYQLFPTVTPPGLGEAVSAAPEFRADQTDSYRYGTTATLGVGSERGNRFTASAEYQHTAYRGEAAGRQDLTTHGARAGYSRGLGRSASVLTEYEYRIGEFQLGSATEHRLNIGAGYSRALSATRRATFRVRVSPSIMDIPETDADALLTGRVQRLQAEGAAEFQLHRSWQAGASYRRNTEYLPAFLEPVLTDSVSAEVAGLITRRLEASASAAYARVGSALTGRVDPLDPGGRLDTYVGTARLRYAISRRLALYTEYLYYVYELRGETLLAPELPPRFEQSGIRMGLMFTFPLF